MYLGEKWVGLEVCQRISASTSRQNSARTALQDAVSCTRETNPKYRCTNQQNQHGIHGSKTEKILPGPLFLTGTLLIWVEAQEVFAHIGQLVHERSPAFQVHSTQLHVIGWVVVGPAWFVADLLDIWKGTCCCSITRKSRSHASDASWLIQKQESDFSTNH